MGKDPYPYQRTGADFLVQHHRAYLADEMGLGKTVQAVMAAHVLGVQRTVVVCPASVTEHWRREWAWWGGCGELTVISYSKLIRIPQQDEQPSAIDLVILDEAHYCKNPSAKRTKAALRLAARAKRAWLLSGTPMPNDPRELYPVIRALWPEWLEDRGIKTAFQWMDRFCVWSDSEYGYRVWGTKPNVKAELLPFLHRIMLRRRIKDVALELPPLRTTVQFLNPDPNLDERIAELGGGGIQDEEHASRLRRLLGSYKAPLIAEVLLPELEAGVDMVVLYHHLDTGRALANAIVPHLPNGYSGFNGSTPAGQRQDEIDHYQQHGGLFLAQQTAAGIGITLTRASEIVLVEPAWSPEDNQQAIKRIHRIGQDRPCRARLFAVPGSMDEGLMNTLARKANMIREVVDGDR